MLCTHSENRHCLLIIVRYSFLFLTIQLSQARCDIRSRQISEITETIISKCRNSSQVKKEWRIKIRNRALRYGTSHSSESECKINMKNKIHIWDIRYFFIVQCAISECANFGRRLRFSNFKSFSITNYCSLEFSTPNDPGNDLSLTSVTISMGHPV